MRSVIRLFGFIILPLSASMILGCASEKVHSDYVGPAAMDQQQIEQLLSDQGYTNVTGLHKNGSDWIGSAMNRNGQEVAFDIDKAGTIHTK